MVYIVYIYGSYEHIMSAILKICKKSLYFLCLLQSLRQGFEREARQTGKPRLLLTAAVPAGKSNIDNGYDIPNIAK